MIEFSFPELTALYVSSRSHESQISLIDKLDVARIQTDGSLASLARWPGTSSDGEMFKSQFLFAAVLDSHRNNVRIGNYFWDEVQYYTNIIDIAYGWLNRGSKGANSMSELWKWLMAYGYLMGSLNYLGAEQALCGVFNSVICFSHRETFYYANYSFAGEAIYRQFRQSYPGQTDPGWRLKPHRDLFPELHRCREEIFSDMNYLRMPVDASICDYGSKNESRLSEVDQWTMEVNSEVLEGLTNCLQRDIDAASFEFVLSGIVTGGIVVYVTIVHILRCTCIKCAQARASRRWRPKDTCQMEPGACALDETEMKCDITRTLHPHPQTKVVTFEEPEYTYKTYEEFNGKPNSIRVATV